MRIWSPTHNAGQLFSRLLAALAVAIGVAVAPVASVRAASGDAVADAVLGQPNFTTRTLSSSDRSGQVSCGSSTTARKLCFPLGVAVSPTGRLFAVDIGNNRVVSWPNAEAFKNGAPADLVLGQPNFVSTKPTCGAPTDHTFCQPQDVAVDHHGRVYVLEPDFSRVVRFSPPFRNGQHADVVIGQRNFTSTAAGCGPGTAPVSARNLCLPQFMTIDQHDALYVSDLLNDRILRFSQPLTTFKAADLVLGQPDFTHVEVGGCNPPSARNLCDPAGVAVDARGAVFVSDPLRNRVLRFSPPLTNGKAADLVLGQRNFTSVIQRCIIDEHVVNAQLICGPNGLTVDGVGNLYVADGENNRVLRFATPSINFQKANLVLGQPNFTTFDCNHGGVSARSLCRPNGGAVDLAGSLFVADSENNRVLRFNRP
jgi:sugar lactone lactonase YvrE